MDRAYLSSFPILLTFLISGYVAGISSTVRDRHPGRLTLRAGLMVWLLGTALILALSALGPDILGALLRSPADVMGTKISAYNTGSVAETVRNDTLGAFFSLLLWRFASALGVGSRTSPGTGMATRPVKNDNATV